MRNSKSDTFLTLRSVRIWSRSGHLGPPKKVFVRDQNIIKKRPFRTPKTSIFLSRSVRNRSRSVQMARYGGLGPPRDQKQGFRGGDPKTPSFLAVLLTPGPPWDPHIWLWDPHNRVWDPLEGVRTPSGPDLDRSGPIWDPFRTDLGPPRDPLRDPLWDPPWDPIWDPLWDAYLRYPYPQIARSGNLTHLRLTLPHGRRAKRRGWLGCRAVEQPSEMSALMNLL